jgi:hypothetical protein
MQRLTRKHVLVTTFLEPPVDAFRACSRAKLWACKGRSDIDDEVSAELYYVCRTAVISDDVDVSIAAKKIRIWRVTVRVPLGGHVN